jgi:type IV secretion system protein VirD4
MTRVPLALGLSALAAVWLLTHSLPMAVAAGVMLAVVIVGAGWAFIPRHHLPRNRVRDMRIRLHLRLHPGRGHATLFELHWRWGRLAAYRQSGRTRPDLTRRERLADPSAHSVMLGRAQYRHRVAADVQNSGAVIGPPRSFKSALLSSVALSAPGALIVTSSKPDLFRQTAPLRARRGPIWIWNPQNVGGIPSNVRWDPLRGCLEPAVAIRRADGFAAGASTSGASDAEFWAGKASDGLRGFFSAAALRQRDMRQVSRWVGGIGLEEAVSILAGFGREEMALQLAELGGDAEKTTQTIRMVMSRAMAWMNDPALAAAVLPGDGEHFDIDRFVVESGTLYLLARTDNADSVLAPLFACFLGEIHQRALQLASVTPGGRLAPPLQMILDEVTRIAPVPLPAWLADSGGQGVQILAGFHGLSQLRERWGTHGAQAIMDTSNLKVITAGVTDPEMLEHLSRICDKVSYRQNCQDQSWQFTEIMSPGMIRQLPDGYALVIRTNCAPVVVRLARGWERRDFRRLAGSGELVAPVPAVTAVPAVSAIDGSGQVLGDRDLTDALPAASANGNGHSAYPWDAR